jgi:hypothetical protein
MAYTTIKKPSDYFNTKLYTGNGSTQSVTGVEFQPDWSWFKVRSEVGSHRLVDAVRGNTKYLYSNASDAEETVATNVTSFDSDGYTLGNGSINESARTYASWNWKANGAGSANTDGSISSTVSANTTSGFSIVSYTGNNIAGATVGHGLSSVPEFIMVKSSSIGSTNWKAQHVSTGTNVGVPNATNAFAADSTTFNNTLPTSSVFTIGTESSTNTNNGTYIAYCFNSVKGFSKFGSYTGNGSTDGPFIYTGFKPAFVLLKRTDSAGSYYIYDNKRDSFNVMTKNLFPNTNDAEDDNSNNNTDFLSNGFKIRTISGARNTSGASYIYMAFAEEPLVGDNPATAR